MGLWSKTDYYDEIQNRVDRAKLAYDVERLKDQMCILTKRLNLSFLDDGKNTLISNNDIKVGDLVQLKSGSVTMTVDSMDVNGKVKCAWLDVYSNDFKFEVFRKETLTLVG